MKYKVPVGAYIMAVVVVSLVGLGLYNIIYTKYQDAQLMKHPLSIGSGIVNACSRQPKSAGGYTVVFRFTYDSRTIDGISRKGMYFLHGSKDVSLFVGKYFPVVIEMGNPNNSEILILPSDFGRFNLPFPDSLSWIGTILM